MSDSPGLPALFLLAVALVTWDEIRHKGHVPPYPQRYVGAAVAFGLLGVLDKFAARLSTALAFGLVLALGYQAVSGAQNVAPDTAPATTTPPAGKVVTPLNGEGFTSAPPVPGSSGGNLAGGPGVR